MGLEKAFLPATRHAGMPEPDRFDLRRDMQFRSTVTAAHWNDAEDQWTVTLESGQQAKSRFLCTAIGILSAHTLPAIPGRDSFLGAAYHPGKPPDYDPNQDCPPPQFDASDAASQASVSAAPASASEDWESRRRPSGRYTSKRRRSLKLSNNRPTGHPDPR